MPGNDNIDRYVFLPPAEIQDAMEKQMKADRERREKVIQAEYHLNRNFMFAGTIPLSSIHPPVGFSQNNPFCTN